MFNKQLKLFLKKLHVQFDKEIIHTCVDTHIHSHTHNLIYTHAYKKKKQIPHIMHSIAQIMKAVPLNLRRMGQQMK